MPEELDEYDLIYIKEFEVWNRIPFILKIKSKRMRYNLTRTSQVTDIILSIN